jgi:SOS-response transcriptional repressor LexA
MAEVVTVRPTKKQHALLDYIAAFIAEHGYSPSYREIMNGCGYNSIATVAVHVNNLISRGHLRKRDHSARSLELTGAVVADAKSGAQKQLPEARWIIAKLETLLAQAEALEAVTMADIKALQALLAALPVLEIALPEAMEPRLRGLQDRIEA